MAHYSVVVQRDRPALFETLAQTLGGEAIRWDRRQTDRRVGDAPVTIERRREDRRRVPPDRWAAGGFVVVARREDGRRTMRLAELTYHGRQAFPPAWREATGQPWPRGLYGELVDVSWSPDGAALHLVVRYDGRRARGVIRVDAPALLPRIYDQLRQQRGRPMAELFFAEMEA
jgi:hypothetical protein